MSVKRCALPTCERILLPHRDVVEIELRDGCARAGARELDATDLRHIRDAAKIRDGVELHRIDVWYTARLDDEFCSLECRERGLELRAWRRAFGDES